MRALRAPRFGSARDEPTGNNSRAPLLVPAREHARHLAASRALLTQCGTHGHPRSHRSSARRARPVREPRQGAGRHRRRPGDRGRRPRHQSLGGSVSRRGPARRARAPLGVARRREARGRARSFRLRSIGDPPGASVSTSAPRPAGFTEVLLARGARRVYAVDVGRGQLHPRLRERPEIVSLEGTDIRALDPARLPERPEFVTIDVSFISLKLVLPAALALAANAGAPAGADQAAIRGRPGATSRRASCAIRSSTPPSATTSRHSSPRSAGTCRGIVPSPIPGGDGNREFFIGAHRT